jgi:hypothetical protein
MQRANDSGSAEEDKHVRIHGYGSNRQKQSSGELSNPEDAFEDPTRPQRKEAINALVDAGFLSSLEANAYLRHVIEDQQSVEQEFPRSSVESAKEKIVAARRSLNILDIYRAPHPPDECSKCGSALGKIWTANLVETPLCLDCAEDAGPGLDS